MPFKSDCKDPDLKNDSLVGSAGNPEDSHCSRMLYLERKNDILNLTAFNTSSS